ALAQPAVLKLSGSCRTIGVLFFALPRHAQTGVAFDGDPLLAANRTQIAGISVDTDVASQLAGYASAAFEGGGAVAPCLDGHVVKPDGVEAVRAPPYVSLEIGLPPRADAAERPPQHPSRATGERIGAVERDGRERNLRTIERDALPNALYLRLECQPWHYRDRVAGLDRTRQFASADIVGVTTDRRWITLDIGPLQHRVDIPVRGTQIGPIARLTGGIE